MSPTRLVRLLLCLATAMLFCGAALSATAPAGPAGVTAGDTLDPADVAIYRKALSAASRSHWQQALSIAGQARDPILQKVLRWDHYRQRGDTGSFDDIAGFMRDNPDWPDQALLQRRAEEALDDKVADDVVLAWFSQRRPRTGAAMIRLAESMMRHGMQDGGIQWLRYAWVHEHFPRKLTRSIYQTHKQHLRPEDHDRRLDHLLWAGRRGDARGMLSLVPAKQRRLAEARMALMARAAGVDAKVAAVPAELRNDPGLIYERARWRRRNGLDQGARDLLAAPLASVGPQPAKWWTERRIAAREALQDGAHDIAYRIAAQHGQVPGSIGYAEGEWLAGWIALRFLSRHEQALAHFTDLYANVRYPVSQARAAYWAGRASEALRRTEDSARWYGIAARLPNTYYGQLAHAATKPGALIELPADPAPGAEERAAFESRELVRAVRALVQVGDTRRARRFLLYLSDDARTETGHAMVAGLAVDAGLTNLSVRAAKGAMRDGHDLYERGYPVLKARPNGVEPALMHAVARQESEFDAKAVSRADARGLMQLLPSTAKQVAHGLRLKYSKARLFDANYNVTLGSAYLGELLDRFDGSYVLAVAGYNAGPNRVKRWLRDIGTPGAGSLDPIDWIELIPISETRNYVQRVLENLQIYRARLSDAPVNIALTQDLQRGGARTASTE